MAEKAGATVMGLYCTVGTCDTVTVVEATDNVVTAVLVKVGPLGTARPLAIRMCSNEQTKATPVKTP
jgi:uncharacterized protein with GYD domain